jgi:hypothetical protein
MNFISIIALLAMLGFTQLSESADRSTKTAVGTEVTTEGAVLMKERRKRVNFLAATPTPTP